MLRGSAWTLHAPRWERSPSLPTETRNLQPNPGSVKKGTLGLFRVRGGSGSCQRHGKRGAGGRAAASSPSQRRHSDRSQPCESLSKRWEPRWWRCHWAGSPDPRGPRGSTKGEPAPPMPSAPSISTHLPRHGAQPGASSFPVCISQKRRLRAGGAGLTPPPAPISKRGSPLCGTPHPSLHPGRAGEQRGRRGEMGPQRPARGTGAGGNPRPPLAFPHRCVPLSPVHLSCPARVPPGRAARRPVPLGTSLGRQRVSRRD